MAHLGASSDDLLQIRRISRVRLGDSSARFALRPQDSHLLFQIVDDLLREFSVGSGSAQVACFKSVMVANGQRSKPFLNISAPESVHLGFHVRRLSASN